MAGEADVFVLLILAIIFPPAAVGFVAGCGADLCLNILLTLLGYLPGMIHAFWLVLRRAEANERYGYKNWIYTGMGEYLPGDAGPLGGRRPASYGSMQGQGQPPPPPGQYPAGTAPPQSQPPTDQKQAYMPQAPPPGRYAPPQPPSNQKAVEVTPAPPTGQKQADSTAQSTAPPGT